MDKYLVRRCLLFVVSLFVNAFGIAFITRALLGTSPITSVNYVLSMFTPLSMGQWTILVNLLFVVLEMPLMKREDFKADRRLFLGQIPVSLCFGFFIDGSMNLLSWLEPTAYAWQIASLLLGCVILAAGIALEVKVNVAMASGEYFVRAIARRFRLDFGYTKLGFDVSQVAIACTLSFCFLSALRGVREGTVVAALAVGPIVHFLTPYLRFLDRWIKAPAVSTAPAATRGVVITIAREFGSGGHLLGERLAKQLNLKLYDKSFIHMAAQHSGMNEDYIRKNEQSIPSFWLKCLQNCNTSIEYSLSPDDVLFLAESKIVHDIAKEPCIIVGRLADFVLKDRPHVVRVFCCTDREDAVRRCVEEYGVPSENAEAEVRRINRNRAAHYEYYTGEKWGNPHRYDLMINTGSTGLDTACRLVKELYDRQCERLSAAYLPRGLK